MRRFEAHWFVAGGWAIDLFLERETRPHDDIEIAVFRRDQLILQNYLDGWLLQKAENGVLSDWNKGEFLELPIHVVHCFRENGELRFLEVLLNETSGEDWIYRRDRNIAKPLSKLHLTSNSGVKFLCPEVVLLYKSKNPRRKDERDFQTVVNYLDAESKRWLKNAVASADPSHHWLESL